ncbi:protein phosphatase 2 (formerly 2A), regulatory subunit B [Angomonas deanei]|nr:protein phosphatase 2 (formerly 2A), regulatory subunit B [Angomonas deanei]|eukprot:EPY31197.1 protein phosphatase 2 (formerly 2A), regulatory subunit B [Angomonas deanei]
MATCNEYVATGDRAGRVSIMRREPITPSQRKTMLSDITRAPPRTTVPYEYHVSQFAYSSVIDPLNNVEVTPNIAALAFLPHTSPSPLLLTANEKVPKLYKVLPSVRKSVDPVRMVDQLEADGTGPLTSPSRDSTVAMKMISRFALNHEYSINSLCPLTDSEQFVSADDLTVQLWCTEYPEISLETYNIRPPGDEDPKEIIRTVKNFPHEPFLLFVVTSAGNVRVIDMRQNLKWFSQSGSLFSNPSRDADGTFGHVTNSLSDCALSPCGRYIAGRDFMTVCLWDVRGATGGAPSMSPSSPIHRKDTTGTNTVTPLRQWELHPHLRQDMEKFYQSDLLFERFDLVFMNRNSVCTGGFNSSLYLLDMDKVAGSANDVQQVQLPALDGCTSVAKQSLKIKCSSANNNTESSKTEIGSRVTLLSSPVASYGGNCEIMASCGQAVTQLNYVAA